MEVSPYLTQMNSCDILVDEGFIFRICYKTGNYPRILMKEFNRQVVLFLARRDQNGVGYTLIHQAYISSCSSLCSTTPSDLIYMHTITYAKHTYNAFPITTVTILEMSEETKSSNSEFNHRLWAVVAAFFHGLYLCCSDLLTRRRTVNALALFLGSSDIDSRYCTRIQHRSSIIRYSKLFCTERKAATIVKQFMVRNGVPGLSVGVSHNGRCVWEQGFGYADVEQLVPCKSDTVMRIASISKSVTAALAARLVQSGKLDLDASIQDYVPDFPKKNITKKTSP
ncbi:Serine beta-lactamase protein LACTB, mitochondrial [Dirofilaria immitis]|nr:Serine beta-lactamase protein LACTB, mitochondrial [Dirofilaria immitis]